MSPASDRKLSAAVAVTLPARVSARCGATFDPREDVWEWTDGPFKARLDFRRYAENSRRLVPSLKLSLLPFVKGHSTSHVRNLNVAFTHFLATSGADVAEVITVQHVSNYAAKLQGHEIGRLGTLNGLLQKWVSLGLPGVDPECARYMKGRRKPGNLKGNAVRTHDPVHGPLSEPEYTALHAAVNDAYGRSVIPLWVLLLTRLLLACGGRVSQYASLKIKDFDCETFVLNLPQAKTRDENARNRFLEFDISPQTGRHIAEYIRTLNAEGYNEESPLFPEALVMAKPRSRERRQATDSFYGHCLGHTLSRRYSVLVDEIAPPTARLDFAPMPITPQRFRYTFGTRLAEEGASKVVIANRLRHSDLQNIDVYVEASPRLLENIDNTIGPLLAPIASAFRGRLVEDESQTTHKGASGSRIIDFRVSSKPLGSCEGKGRGCAFNKPVACYTCFRFEPWLDAPHDKVLQKLEEERQRWAADSRIGAVNDEPIRAVREVIEQCTQALKERGEEHSRGDL